MDHNKLPVRHKVCHHDSLLRVFWSGVEMMKVPGTVAPRPNPELVRPRQEITQSLSSTVEGTTPVGIGI